MTFKGLRVVEIGSGVALDYCGKLFAELGAEVIKIEPPEGDPLRTAPPLVEAERRRAESAYFAWLNTYKKSVVADLSVKPDRGCVLEVLSEAHVVLDGRPIVEVTSSPLTHAEIRAAAPTLIITAISWFGEQGPYRDFMVTDSVCRSLAGLVKTNGPAEGPPILGNDGQLGIIAGLASFIQTAAALYGRGFGKRFSVSIHDAALTVAEYQVAIALANGEPPRLGINRNSRHYPCGIFPTKEGMLGVTVVTPAQWRGFIAMLGNPELADDPRFKSERAHRAAEIDAIVLPQLLKRTAEEWFARARELRLPIVPVPDMATLLQQQVHRERGAFVPIAIGTAAFEAPASPLRLQYVRRRGGRAPQLGQNPAAWTLEAGQWLADAEPTADKGLLAGLRIVDLTMGWAGPSATRHLADLGAEVIKVEACQYPDWWRGSDRTTPGYLEGQQYEKSRWFQAMNRNKLGITIDLSARSGIALFKRLVASADAVIENYSVDVLPKLGIDYIALSQVKPDLVMVSMPAFGSDNQWSSCRAYGSTLEQASGLPSVTGRPEDPPALNHVAYGDPVGGYNAAAALIAALVHRKRTGLGQYVDISQVECMLPLAAPAIIEQSVSGTVAPRRGNRHPVFVPHGAFPTADADGWITIAVTDDAAWQALAKLIGHPELAADTAFASAEGRRAREDEIEAMVTAWTRTHGGDAAMAALQAVGVAAGVARGSLDLLSDPHLAVRGFWQATDHAVIGRHMQAAAPYRDGDQPYGVMRPAPLLGEHNASVLGQGLGLSAEDLVRLEREGVIGTRPVVVQPAERPLARDAATPIASAR
jgi:crotonobetainyl-CoA:carnitine CoA-transferase CaiB-like acyl-CoA transferase